MTSAPRAELAITATPETFPSLQAISAAHFSSVVPVYTGPERTPEAFEVKSDATRRSRTDAAARTAFTGAFNMCWEAGPYRPDWVRRMQPESLGWIEKVTSAGVDVMLLPTGNENVLAKWEPLYHLLPEATLRRFGLPMIPGGRWPRTATLPVGNRLHAGDQPRLSAALCHHLWPLIGQAGSPPSAFDRNDPIRVLAHDGDFWLPYLELVLRDLNRSLGRAAISVCPDQAMLRPNEHDDVHHAVACRGGVLFEGEEDAWSVCKKLVERADGAGQLRAILEAVRSHRVEEDFSSRWSFAREDFERKLYRKRSKWRVSFVELNDTIPVHGDGAEVEGDLVWRDLMAVVAPKDRRVVVLLRNGHTRVGEMAAELGYANHSPVSKALARIRERAKVFIDE